ncbi:hypothetical protein Tco_0034159 [Tanacetum coccineum]
MKSLPSNRWGGRSGEIFVSPTLKVTDWSSCLKVISSPCTSIRALTVLKNGLPKINETLGHVQRASAKLISEVRFRKFSINFKDKRSSFSRIFSLFTLDGYGKVALVLGMTTGSSTWTIGVGLFDFLRKKAPCPFVTSFQLPPPKVELSPSYETSAICLRDVFLDVILGNCSIGKSDNYNMSGPPPQEQTLLNRFYGSGCWNGRYCLSRSRALTISFNSATSGDTPEVEALVLTLATMALLRELRTLDLLSMMLEQSAGLLSKKLPPAAEFKES